MMQGTPDLVLLHNSLYTRGELTQLSPYSSDHTPFLVQLRSRDRQRRGKQRRGKGYRLREADWSTYRALLSQF
eukprot:5814966-Amphidinium_carterae.1